jgi:tetratricopeptide (TPR) repeat protein
VGRIDEAIEALRAGLAVDPLSTKHHFVLANLLQKQNLIYEAIDEYEATVNLKPDYFPALSRLAYLYYKKGFSAKAIETWRRSLPHCPDPALRQNIEVFMRKLISEMQSEGGGPK